MGMIVYTELAARVRKLTEAGKGGQIGCGGGVVLAVKPSGHAIYYARSRVGGKVKLTRLGTYKELTLAQARQAARDATTPPEPQDVPTSLPRLIAQWLEVKAATVAPVTLTYLRRCTRYLTTALPTDTDVTTLTPIAVVNALRAVQAPENQLPRICRTLKAVLDWAVSVGLIDTHRCGLIGAAVPQPPVSDGFRWVPASGLRDAFFKPLEHVKELYACYYLMLALTGLRAGVTRALRWDWVHADHIAIPAEAMKMRRPFKVPVTSHIAALLDRLRGLRHPGSPYLFSATGAQPVSQTYTQRPMSAMCPAMTLHGLRKTLSTWLGEQVDDKGMPLYPYEIREMVLAHTVGSNVARIYDHGDYLAPRRAALQAWGDYLLAEALTTPWLALLGMPALRVVG